MNLPLYLYLYLYPVCLLKCCTSVVYPIRNGEPKIKNKNGFLAFLMMLKMCLLCHGSFVGYEYDDLILVSLVANQDFFSGEAHG